MSDLVILQLALISAFLTTVIDASIPPEHTSLPPGYYAFETGGRRHGTPPRVRPPPYIPTDVPCPGELLVVVVVLGSISFRNSFTLSVCSPCCDVDHAIAYQIEKSEREREREFRIQG